jgi:predicted RNA methylase
MLSDFVRCLTYKNAIEEYSDLIRNKVVLDVGCGTGLLSCFCAKVGAKKGFFQRPNINTKYFLSKKGEFTVY